MTFRDFTFTCWDRPHLAPVEGTREDHLNALIDQAQRHMHTALKSEQPTAIRSASHFLLGAQALLNRWLDRRHREDEEREEEYPWGDPHRLSDVEYRGIRKLFDINTAALEEWLRYCEEFKAEDKQAQQDKAA